MYERQQKFLHQVVHQKYPTSIHDIRGILTKKALLSATTNSHLNIRPLAVIYPILNNRKCTALCSKEI